jgi:hypothetical protein
MDRVSYNAVTTRAAFRTVCDYRNLHHLFKYVKLDMSLLIFETIEVKGSINNERYK